MEPAVRISRSEMEAFLSDILEFTNKYELVLNELDMAHTKLEGIRERIRQYMSRSAETLRQMRDAIEKMCRRTEDMLEESLSERA